MYLLDTNIFLEIILGQLNADKCKNFIKSNQDNIYISDFSLHSIGVILFRHKKQKTFNDFIDDIITIIKLVTLPSDEYRKLTGLSAKYNLDFDDLYQYSIAKHFDLQIVTMDTDFKSIKDIKIIFI